MATVYIETTIPSFYFETRADARSVAWREATREWWDVHRSSYDLVTSAIVLREIRNAPHPKSADMEAMLARVTLLKEAPGLTEAAAFYLEHRLMPRDALADAFHLAMVSVHNVDYLLTWNIRHLANANKTRHLQVLNGRLGLPTPIITTPELLVPESPHGESPAQ